jgi:hypothetical protein
MAKGPYRLRAIESDQHQHALIEELLSLQILSGNPILVLPQPRKECGLLTRVRLTTLRHCKKKPE